MADPIVRVRIVAEDRAAATIRRVQESSKGLQTELRKLGVSLERDVNSNLKRNAIILEETRRAYEAGTITLRDFTRAQAAVGAQNEALRAKLAGTGTAAQSASKGFQSLGAGLASTALRIGSTVLGLGALVRGFRAIVKETPQFQAVASELQDLAGRFTTAASVAIDLGGAFDNAAQGAESYRSAVAEAGTATGNFITLGAEVLGGLGRIGADVFGGIGDLVIELAKGLGVAGDAFQEFTGISLESASAIDKAAEATARLNRIMAEEKSTFQETAKFAKELGVTLEQEVAQKIDTTAQALERSRAAAAAGVISWQDYANLVAAAAAQSEKLNAKVTGTTAALDEQAVSADELAAGLSELTEEQREATRANQSYANSARQAAIAQAQFNATVGRVVARSPGGQERIDRAVATGQRITLVQGGTRARILNGGSVLVRP